MPPTTRGFKEKKELPPTLKVCLDKGKPKYLAVAPGMDVAGLKAALKHVFKDELKKYDKEYKEYELIGVQLTHGEGDTEFTELVPLDALARAPAVALENDSVDLILSVSPPKPKSDTAPWWLTSGFVLVALIIGRFFLLRSLLRKLYRTGPSFRTSIGAWGFWEGQPLASICAQLTGAQDVSFWRSNREQCVRIFASREEAFIVAVEFVLIAAVAYSFRADIQKAVLAVPNAMYGLTTKGIKPLYDQCKKHFDAYGGEATKWQKEKEKKLWEKVKEHKWLYALPFLPIIWIVALYGPVSPILQ